MSLHHNHSGEVLLSNIEGQAAFTNTNCKNKDTYPTATPQPALKNNLHNSCWALLSNYLPIEKINTQSMKQHNAINTKGKKAVQKQRACAPRSEVRTGKVLLWQELSPGPAVTSLPPPAPRPRPRRDPRQPSAATGTGTAPRHRGILPPARPSPAPASRRVYLPLTVKRISGPAAPPEPAGQRLARPVQRPRPLRAGPSRSPAVPARLGDAGSAKAPAPSIYLPTRPPALAAARPSPGRYTGSRSSSGGSAAMASAAQSRSPPPARPGALTHQQRWRRRAGPRGGGIGIGTAPSGGAGPAPRGPRFLGPGRWRTGHRGSRRHQRVTRDPSRRLPSPSCCCRVPTRAAESPRSADGTRSSERLDVGHHAAVLVHSAPGDI